MNQPRWVISATGFDEDGDSVTHSILEFDRTLDAYVAIAQFFTAKAARLVYEALYWQEQLQKGVPVSLAAKTKPSKKSKGVTVVRALDLTGEDH